MSWTAPARDAELHGVAGEFVTRTAPHTRVTPDGAADPVPGGLRCRRRPRRGTTPWRRTRHGLNESRSSSALREGGARAQPGITSRRCSPSSTARSPSAHLKRPELGRRAHLRGSRSEGDGGARCLSSRSSDPSEAASSGPFFVCHRCHLCRLAPHSPFPPPSPPPDKRRAAAGLTCQRRGNPSGRHAPPEGRRPRL
jgi:hypothetical protein